jgi:5-methylcytosine-specific restriction endonuclease McrA
LRGVLFRNEKQLIGKFPIHKPPKILAFSNSCRAAAPPLRIKRYIYTDVDINQTRMRCVSASLKQNVWLAYNKDKFNCKCYVEWCQNIITPFNFEAGHDIPYSKGGETTIDNLIPICGPCNKSMGNTYTIQEYSALFAPKPKPVPIVPKLQCQSCQHVFSRKYILTKHIQICKGVKNVLECQYCHKVFKYRSNKYAHVHICPVKKEKEKEKQEAIPMEE